MDGLRAAAERPGHRRPDDAQPARAGADRILRTHSANALHTLIEAKKLAYADMARHVADPACHPVPAAALLSKAYAAGRSREIDPHRASSEACPGDLPEKSS